MRKSCLQQPVEILNSNLEVNWLSFWNQNWGYLTESGQWTSVSWFLDHKIESTLEENLYHLTGNWTEGRVRRDPLLSLVTLVNCHNAPRIHCRSNINIFGFSDMTVSYSSLSRLQWRRGSGILESDHPLTL